MACISKQGMMDHARALIDRADDMRADIDADYDNDCYEQIAVERACADELHTLLSHDYLNSAGMKWVGDRLDGIEMALNLLGGSKG